MSVEPAQTTNGFPWSREDLYREFGLNGWSLRFALAGFNTTSHRQNGRYSQEVYDYLTECVWWRNDMATELDVSVPLVQKIIRASRYRDWYIENDKHVKLFPRACFAYVWQRTAEFRAVPKATDAWVQLSWVCEELTLHIESLERIIESHPELRLEPIRRLRFGVGQPGRAMRRTAYRRLAKWLPPFAPDDWFSVSDLHRLTGWHPVTIVKRLAGLVTRPYRCGKGCICDHYPEAALKVLGVKPRDVQPAGDWLTRGTMRTRLRTSYRRLEQHLNHRRREPRLDDSGAVRPHWPPSECDRLEPLLSS